MPHLNELLQSKTDKLEKLEFIQDLFDKLSKQVNQILPFGPSNGSLAEKIAPFYYNRNSPRFFAFKYQKEELEALSAVVAYDLYAQTTHSKTVKQQTDVTQVHSFDFEEYMQSAFLYGTWTCEFFAVIGAYCLALEYDVELSIETIFSNESHTYLRLHTDPEYIFDFWSSMSCEYTDNITWHEVLGEPYKRKNAEYKTDMTLNSAQIIEMAERIFTKENEAFSTQIINKVECKVSSFLHTQSVPHTSLEFQLPV